MLTITPPPMSIFLWPALSSSFWRISSCALSPPGPARLALPLMKWAYSSVWVMRKFSLRCWRLAWKKTKETLMQLLKQNVSWIKQKTRDTSRDRISPPHLPLSSPRPACVAPAPPSRPSSCAPSPLSRISSSRASSPWWGAEPGAASPYSSSEPGWPHAAPLACTDEPAGASRTDVKYSDEATVQSFIFKKSKPSAENYFIVFQNKLLKS